MASRTDMPSSSSRCANSTIKMLLDTTIPTIMMTPMSDITFSVVPVSRSVSRTPITPVGTARRMRTAEVTQNDGEWSSSFTQGTCPTAG